MPRTPSAHNAAEFTKNTTRPHFLVLLDFSTPIRLSTRGTLSFDGNTYTGKVMEVEISLDGLSGRIRLFDDDFAITAALRAEGGADTPVKVWALFGDGFSPGDEDLYFSGVIGNAAEVNGMLELPLGQSEFRFAPNLYINANNGFSHLPPSPAEFHTSDGIIILEE